MNDNTPWLQVPAAKTQPLNNIGLASSVEKTSDKLENIANILLTLQTNKTLTVENTTLIYFSVDHGLIKNNNNLSQSTYTKLHNICSATSDTNRIMNKIFNTNIEVINVATHITQETKKAILDSRTYFRDDNICHTPAMDNEQLSKAINVGRQSAQRMKLNDAQLFIAKDINDVNTLSALAMTSALLNLKSDKLTDINTEKKQLIQRALVKHKIKLTSPLEILRCLGSFEIAALTGSYLCCAHMGLPVLIDGFSSAVAALVVSTLCPNAEKWFIYSTTPNIIAHKNIFESLKAEPLLHTHTNLDNVAGIIMALSLLQLTCNNHNEILHFVDKKSLKKYS